jgi:hypothetical protein
MEFDNERDFEICAHLRGEHPLLGDAGYSFRREFHTNDDAHMFLNKQTKGSLPLYEGKTIHQFNSNFSSVRRWMTISYGRTELVRKEVTRIKRQIGNGSKSSILEQHFEKHDWLLDYETYRMVYRKIGRSTDERTLIATILPREVFSVDSVNYLVNCYYEASGDEVVQLRRSNLDVLFISSILNSLTLNYYIRNKVSANLTMNFLYELPVPAVQDSVKHSIAEQGFMLLAANAQGKEFDELGAELGVSGSFAMRGGEEAIMRRAGLEVQIARDVYGLTAEEWQHIVSTFSYGGDSDTKQELDAVIAASLTLFTQSIETIS